ncbi:MAG TPA: arginase family protein [Chryseolinea sp.]|nr:arginase family protein [Chryseolinea sp.]
MRKYDIQIISAPSILGLRPTGVEAMADALLAAGLRDALSVTKPGIFVPTLNDTYDPHRDAHTRCLNPSAIADFSRLLAGEVAVTIRNNNFAFVLGGDCSILLGAMLGLKPIGQYGLIFLDAHADFYGPDQSPTGEVADMDLALVSGRGPAELTNLNDRCPYVLDENIIHIGQRDELEVARYGAPDIRDTMISCYDLKSIRDNGIESTMGAVLQAMRMRLVEGFWIHFDTDVLADDMNPAVDYRLPGGLTFQETAYSLKSLLQTGRIAGITVTIFNPALDVTGQITRNILNCLTIAFGFGK